MIRLRRYYPGFFDGSWERTEYEVPDVAAMCALPWLTWQAESPGFNGWRISEHPEPHAVRYLMSTWDDGKFFVHAIIESGDTSSILPWQAPIVPLGVPPKASAR